MVILDGKNFALNVRQNLKEKVLKIQNEKGVTPGLAVVIIGEDPASKIYVNNKIKACEQTGIKSFNVVLSENISQEEAENAVKTLANNSEVDGIIVQLPLPKKFNAEKILKNIPVEKDVDGLCSENLGKLLTGKNSLVSCTPQGVIEILKGYNVDISGKNAVVLGRSNMVGKPVAILLEQENATVTICHSKTKDVKSHLLNADIIVAAIGKAKFVTEDMVKDGAVVVDVGINRIDGKIFGDVDFEMVKEKCSYITPVPGGVGPMTVTMLLKNTIIACLRNRFNEEF